TSKTAGLEPNRTPVAPDRLVPVMVMVSVPPLAPEVALRPVTVGAPSKYVNWSALDVLDVPKAVVTVMWTVHAVSAGAMAEIVPSPLTTKAVAAVLPKVTAGAPTRLVPE